MSIKAGTYKARGVVAALGFTAGGKEQVAVQLAILSEGHEGETVTWFGYFSDAATDRTLESLRHLGWQGDDLFDLTGIDGNEVSIVLEEDDYNGKTSIKVKWINEIRGLTLKAPMTDAQAKAFSARMKGAAVGQRQRAGTPPAKPTQSAQRPLNGRGRDEGRAADDIGDDEIPF